MKERKKKIILYSLGLFVTKIVYKLAGEKLEINFKISLKVGKLSLWKLNLKSVNISSSIKISKLR